MTSSESETVTPLDKDRRFSTASVEALENLEGLESSFADLASSVKDIEIALAEGKAPPTEELIAMKHRLAQLNGDLEKFQVRRYLLRPLTFDLRNDRITQ